MIIRLFRVRVPQDLQEEFEQNFVSISVPYVQACSGLIDVKIGKLISSNSPEYLMISQWESIEAIALFADGDWQNAVIPDGMEKYVLECFVEHFEQLVTD